MDVGSIVWFRQPAEAQTRSRRSATVAGAAAATHEDSWRPWHKGKILKAMPLGVGTTFTVDKIHEASKLFFSYYSLWRPTTFRRLVRGG
jgi:hypothetical protein